MLLGRALACHLPGTTFIVTPLLIFAIHILRAAQEIDLLVLLQGRGWRRRQGSCAVLKRLHVC
jgi:hypothetical protein